MATAAGLTVPPMIAEGIAARPLAPGTSPRRVVVVRLHAFGDAVIALPLLGGLRAALPDAHLTFITSAPYAEMFRAVEAVDEVMGIRTDGSRMVRAVAAVAAGVRARGADLLLDVQRSAQSGLIRRAAGAPAWAAFDRFAPRTALDRYLDAARAVGLGALAPSYAPKLRPAIRDRACEILRRAGHDVETDARPLICVNPAGCWPTKNWPIDAYVALARRFVSELNARILLIGTGHALAGAERIADDLGAAALNLVGRTTAADALALMEHLRLMVSDDSGLMHLAWISGVPTLGLFGASRSTWSRPCGPHADCLVSEDLPCGACMSPTCARGDLVCLRRVGHEEVFMRCLGLMGMAGHADRSP